jgi:hypothetical protein
MCGGRRLAWSRSLAVRTRANCPHGGRLDRRAVPGGGRAAVEVWIHARTRRVRGRLCGVLDVVLAVVDFGRRVDFRVRRHRGHAAHGGGAYPSRTANLLAAEFLPQRGAPQSSKTRGTSPRGPAEPSVAAPGNRLRPSQRAFSGTHAHFRYWVGNGSKQAEAWIFGSLRLDDWEYNMGYGDALRDEVHNDNITPLIGIFDMYSASLAAQHYGGMFVSGFGFAAS